MIKQNHVDVKAALQCVTAHQMMHWLICKWLTYPVKQPHFSHGGSLLVAAAGYYLYLCLARLAQRVARYIQSSLLAIDIARKLYKTLCVFIHILLLTLSR